MRLVGNTRKLENPILLINICQYFALTGLAYQIKNNGVGDAFRVTEGRGSDCRSVDFPDAAAGRCGGSKFQILPTTVRSRKKGRTAAGYKVSCCRKSIAASGNWISRFPFPRGISTFAAWIHRPQMRCSPQLRQGTRRAHEHKHLTIDLLEALNEV